MLTFKVIWLLALTLGATVTAQRSCFTPYNTYGRCVPYQECNFIKKLLAQHAVKLSADSVNDVRKWVCPGRPDERNFCCDESLTMPELESPTTDPPYGEDYVPSLDARGVSILSAQKCGNADDVRVANGETADLFEFPWTALLRYNTPDHKFKCGGTLITNNYVLTAAHCMVGIRDKLIGVRLGEYDLSKDIDCVRLGTVRVCSPPAEDYGIEKAIPHPRYSKSYKTYDVGLVKLSRPAEYNRHIKPICLPITAEAASIGLDQDLFIAGWGYTEKGSTANILQKAVLTYTNRADCRKVFRRTPINENHICAGGDTNVDACKGDSGGPLFSLTNYNNIQRYVQIGIVSFGAVECGGDKKVPGIYSNVAHLMPWITSNID